MSTDIVQQKAKTLQALLEVSKKQIEAALPRHLTPDRLLRIAMTEARKNPALLDCTQASFIGSIIQTAQLGLEPGGILGHSYLVPFKNKKKGTTEVQLIVGYKGMMDLAYRSPKVSHVIARAVYEGDKFEYKYGLDEKLDHVPDPECNGQKLTHVYAIVFLKEGGKIFDVMEVKEVEAARKRSKSSEDGPWATDYEAMAKKSVVRRLFRYMPVSIELQEAIGMDEAGERGEQNNGAVIETTGINLGDEPPQSKTDEFKKNLGAETPPPAAPPADEEPGEFQSFGSGPPVGAAPPPAAESEKVKTKAELVSEMFDLAKKLGLSMKDISKRCKDEFGKEPAKLAEKDIETLNLSLNAELAKKGTQ